MNNKAQFTPLKKAVHAIPMLYAEAFAGSNNKEFVVELYKDARLLETAAPAMYGELSVSTNLLCCALPYLPEAVAKELVKQRQINMQVLSQAEGQHHE